MFTVRAKRDFDSFETQLLLKHFFVKLCVGGRWGGLEHFFPFVGGKVFQSSTCCAVRLRGKRMSAVCHGALKAQAVLNMLVHGRDCSTDRCSNP